MAALTVAEVEAWVGAHEAEIVAFLGEYIRQRSVNPNRVAMPGQEGGEGPAQAWLSRRVEAAGLGPVDSWEQVAGRPNVAWSLGPAGAEPGMAFNGHADTVGVTEEQARLWPFADPFSGDVVDGRCYGRGACDMKAGTTAFYWAGKLLADLGVPLRRRLLMTVSSGEETTESDLGILTFLRRGYEAPIWVMAEPTDMKVCPAGLGIVYFRVTVFGETSHVSNRAISLRQLRAFESGALEAMNAGVDASSYAFRIYGALEELEAEELERPAHPLGGPGGGRGICAVRLSGGALRAEMMDRCVLELAATLDPGDSVKAFMGRVEERIGSLVAGSRWLRARPPLVEWPIVHAAIEPLRGPQDDELLDAVRGVGRLSAASELQVSCMPGPCDANVLAEHGRRAIVCGPARLEDGGHGIGEFVAVESLLAAVRRFALMAAAVCGTEGIEA